MAIVDKVPVRWKAFSSTGLLSATHHDYSELGGTELSAISSTVSVAVRTLYQQGMRD